MGADEETLNKLPFITRTCRVQCTQQSAPAANTFQQREHTTQLGILTGSVWPAVQSTSQLDWDIIDVVCSPSQVLWNRRGVCLSVYYCAVGAARCRCASYFHLGGPKLARRVGTAGISRSITISLRNEGRCLAG